MHHQGIDEVGSDLRVVARAEDGLPEALEVPSLPFFVGVQWHPEELTVGDQFSAGLFSEFVRIASHERRDRVPVKRLHGRVGEGEYGPQQPTEFE